MPVTYTTPVAQPDFSGGELVEMWVNHSDERGLLRYVDKGASGEVLNERIFRFGGSSEDDFPYAALITAMPSLATSRTEGETGLMNAGLIPDGTVL